MSAGDKHFIDMHVRMFIEGTKHMVHLERMEFLRACEARLKEESRHAELSAVRKAIKKIEEGTA